MAKEINNNNRLSLWTWSNCHDGLRQWMGAAWKPVVVDLAMETVMAVAVLVSGRSNGDTMRNKFHSLSRKRLRVWT